MNTQLPVNPRSSHKPAMLTTHPKTAAVHGESEENSQTKLGKSVNNLSLRYPKELERCFVLGNN